MQSVYLFALENAQKIMEINQKEASSEKGDTVAQSYFKTINSL